MADSEAGSLLPRHGPRAVLETARLSLRELVVDDLDFVATMLSDPEVMRYYPKLLSKDEALDWIELQRRRYERDGYGLWLVLERSSGRPIGQVGAVAVDVSGDPEPALTYLIHRPFWRRGFAAEAALATCEYAFEELGAPRLITLIRPENTPSEGVARKLGMQPEGRVQFKGFRHTLYVLYRPNT